MLVRMSESTLFFLMDIIEGKKNTDATFAILVKNTLIYLLFYSHSCLVSSISVHRIGVVESDEWHNVAI